jgi:hypothetical protein
MRKLLCLGLIAFGSLASLSTLADQREYPALICTSESGAPWTVKLRGTLTRTQSKNELAYRFDGGSRTFSWRFVTRPNGATRTIAPGFLIQHLLGASDEPPRSQTLRASGEILEYGGRKALALVTGSTCPAPLRRQ